MLHMHILIETPMLPRAAGVLVDRHSLLVNGLPWAVELPLHCAI